MCRCCGDVQDETVKVDAAEAECVDMEAPEPTNYEKAYAYLIEGADSVEAAAVMLGPENECDWYAYGNLLDSLRGLVGIIRTLENQIQYDRAGCDAVTPS